MSASKVSASAAVVAVTVWVGLSGAAPAGASDGWGINGTFATSANGDWAKINERYENQPSVRSTWTVSTSCTSPTDCAGTVTSDEGWTAPIYTTNGLWYVKHVVPQWRFCADGTPIEGLQTHKLYPVGADAHVDLASTEYTGESITVGASGSCGRNQWPTIRMPFYMKKI
ncbi:hypothetical protein A5784_02315 [Mycobacterium sp. 852013-50091_SCH5140682]|uniref:hypothetical protein n=1 Tax=Mycobacterium sp. 852013-50091_SCH5140682 TaxID=1834109 RepID=UPI0007EBF66F|nr:hypothetical protein [Mycobacterium sp. 852013-50091_SCH5140682]OBC01067.1 hypothetical protein A5784_02315 [Mycobacterium sp. 852013-50091_SCH5140682]